MMGKVKFDKIVVIWLVNRKGEDDDLLNFTREKLRFKLRVETMEQLLKPILTRALLDAATNRCGEA